TTAQLACRHVVQHVGTNDEVELAVEAQFAELTERSKPDIARLAVARDNVFAAVDAQILDLRTQLAQRLAPDAFPATYVEHAAHVAAEVILGSRDGERNLALELLARCDRVPRIAIPLLEVGAVVGLSFYQRYAQRHSDPAIGAHSVLTDRLRSRRGTRI